MRNVDGLDKGHETSENGKNEGISSSSNVKEERLGATVGIWR